MQWNILFFFNSVLLGMGLAMDAFSVSLANGLNEPHMSRRRMLDIAGVFAAFQALMPMTGWVCVHTIVQYFRAFEKLIPWIALALLGNILLSVAFYEPGVPPVESMDQVEAFRHLARQRAEALAVLDAPQSAATYLPWLKAAFIFLLVGYGTKMGLAPLHNWLPDAHSQAPSLVSALLSGALLNCAFLGILRGHQIMLGAGLGGFSGTLLVFFGLVSMFVARSEEPPSSSWDRATTSACWPTPAWSTWASWPWPWDWAVRRPSAACCTPCAIR